MKLCFCFLCVTRNDSFCGNNLEFRFHWFVIQVNSLFSIKSFDEFSMYKIG